MGSVRSSWRASSISPRPFFCWTRADASRVSAKPGGNCGGNTEVSRLSRDEPRVSVVVSAYNEERHVERLIHSLHVQTLPAYEVIVIDDGSSDDTAARAERAGATVLTVAHAGPAAGRNRGARAAIGEILVFLDGDMACAPGFLAAITAPIRRDETIGTFSKEIFVGEPANAWSRAYCHIRRIGYPRLLSDDFPERWSN